MSPVKELLHSLCDQVLSLRILGVQFDLSFQDLLSRAPLSGTEQTNCFLSKSSLTESAIWASSASSLSDTFSVSTASLHGVQLRHLGQRYSILIRDSCPAANSFKVAMSGSAAWNFGKLWILYPSLSIHMGSPEEVPLEVVMMSSVSWCMSSGLRLMSSTQ